MSKQIENWQKAVPIIAGAAYVTVILIWIAREYERRCRTRDLQQLELGIHIGTGITQGIFSGKNGDGTIDGDKEQRRAAEGIDGQEAAKKEKWHDEKAAE